MTTKPEERTITFTYPGLEKAVEHESSGKSPQELQTIRAGIEQERRDLAAIDKVLQDRLAAIDRALQPKHAVATSKSFAEERPQEAIESLGLPEDVEAILGRKGLGIRTTTQMVQYNRNTLREQLLQFKKRAIDKQAPNTDDIDGALDILEAKLALKGLYLAGK